MNTSAIILLCLVWGVVAFFTIKFFVVILKTPKNPETDSFSDNDKEV